MMRNDKPKRMPRALQKAVKATDLEKIKSILADKKYLDPAWLNAVNSRGRTALQLALKYKCFDVARLLLTHTGVDLKVIDPYGRNLLELCVEDADIFLRILNDANAPVLTENVALTALCESIKNDDRVDVLQVLITKGINLNGKVRGETILKHAVESRRKEFVRLLLEQPNIDVNTFNPLVAAAFNKDVEILTLLVNYPSINVNLSNTVNKPIDALHFMSGLSSNQDKNALQCLKVLLSHPKIDSQWFNECDSLLKWVMNVSPRLFRQIISLPSTQIISKYRDSSHDQYFVIKCNYADAVNLLINDPELSVNHKMSAIAAYGSNRSTELDCMKSLLCSSGIDKQYIKHCGTPLLIWLSDVNPALFRKILSLPSAHVAIDHHSLQVRINGVDALNILVNDPGFDINMRIWDGRSLLTLAINDHRDDLMSILLNCPRIDLHNQNMFGHTAITQADKAGRSDLVDIFMKHSSFNLSATYSNNQNLLMLAAEKNCANLVRVLLRTQHFAVNAADDDGNTALILLAKHHKNANDATLFTELLDHGADPQQKNKNGINAIMAAKDAGLKGIAHELKFAVPRALPDPHPGASAPSLEDMESNEVIAKAAEEPPLGYHNQGLFVPAKQGGTVGEDATECVIPAKAGISRVVP